MGNYSIPKMGAQALLNLARNIKPLVQREDSPEYPATEESRDLRFIQPVDIERIAFTWEPEPVASAENLQAIGDIRTLHTFAYQGFFKPSVAEVLAQIPEDVRQQTVAFYTRLESHDIEDRDKIFTPDRSHHVAVTTLYAGVLPESVRNQDVILNGRVYKRGQAAPGATGGIKPASP